MKPTLAITAVLTALAYFLCWIAAKGTSYR